MLSPRPRAQCVAGLQYSLHAPAGKSLLLQSRRTQQRTQHFLGHILIAVTRQHCTAYWHTLTWLHTGYWILDTPPNVSNSSHLARAKVGDESGRWWVAAGAREVSSNQCPVQSCCCPHNLLTPCRYNQMLERDLI